MTYRGRCEGRRWRSSRLVGASTDDRQATHKRRVRASMDWVLTEHAETFRKLAAYDRGEDVALSPRSRKMLDEGLESAKRGEMAPWRDFTKDTK